MARSSNVFVTAIALLVVVLALARYGYLNMMMKEGFQDHAVFLPWWQWLLIGFSIGFGVIVAFAIKDAIMGPM